MNSTELEAYLHEHIPISHQMGIRVVRADLTCVELGAPLEPNVNHRSTVFGGSCASVAMLAAWSLTLLRINDAGLDFPVVIQRGAMDYLAPIEGEFSATAKSPDEVIWARFMKSLERGRPARIELNAEVGSASGTVARMTASYVVIPSCES
ncbi:MAG TPA: YiiD C-terminal domain-containing protein [Candidatus Limnocylindrales bacterium]